MAYDSGTGLWWPVVFRGDLHIVISVDSALFPEERSSHVGDYFLDMTGTGAGSAGGWASNYVTLDKQKAIDGGYYSKLLDGSGENSNSSGVDNLPCVLTIHPLNEASRSGHASELWGIGLAVNAIGTRAVIRPPGAPVAKPAFWVGDGNCVPRSASDAAQNDLWDVASAGGAVTLPLASRYFTRLYALQTGTADASYYDNPRPAYITDVPPNKMADWVIMLLANLGAGTTLDCIDWLDPTKSGNYAGYNWVGLAAENPYFWRLFSQAQLTITAPASCAITIVINYSTITVDDPCYSSEEYRFIPGENGPAEWTFTRTQHVATYTVDKDNQLLECRAGANTFTLDLLAPTTGDQPPQLHHVDSIQITGLCLGEWQMGEITLQNYVVGVLTANTIREVLPWKLYGLADYFGVAGRFDGDRVLDHPIGYEVNSQEHGMQQIQKSRHNPDSEAEGILDAAKALGRLLNELSWLEGLTASYPLGEPLDLATNKDTQATPQRLLARLTWWDLLRSHEVASGMVLAPVVSAFTNAAGPAYVMEYETGVEGVADLLVYDGRQRARSIPYTTAYYVDLAQHPTGSGDWTTIARVETDATGRAVFPPELSGAATGPYDYYYRIGVEDGAGNITWRPGTYNLDHKEYTWSTTLTALARKRLTQLWSMDRELQVYVARPAGLLYAVSRDLGHTWPTALQWNATTDGTHDRPAAVDLAGGPAHAVVFQQGADIAWIHGEVPPNSWDGATVGIAGQTILDQKELPGERKLCVMATDGATVYQHIVDIGSDGKPDYPNRLSFAIPGTLFPAGIPQQGIVTIIPGGTAVFSFDNGTDIASIVSYIHDGQWEAA
jgi:hypothetical protein